MPAPGVHPAEDNLPQPQDCDQTGSQVECDELQFGKDRDDLEVAEDEGDDEQGAQRDPEDSLVDAGIGGDGASAGALIFYSGSH